MNKMVEESELKIIVWVLTVIGLILWFYGVFGDDWQSAVSGLFMLVAAGWIDIDIRIRRIEKKI